METNEIIRRLELVRNAYEVNLCGQLPKSEIDANIEAQNLAIQAVKLLEQIKEDVRGRCYACAYTKRDTIEEPCVNCSEEDDKWVFRWPLGKDAAK